MDEIQDLLRQAVEAHRQGLLEDADALYGVILARAPGHVDALNLRGLAAQALGDGARAVDCYRAFLDRVPDHAVTWSNLGSALLETGDIQAAVKALSEAVRLDPTRAEARVNLGNALRKLGDAEGARAAYAKAAADAPDLAAVPYNLGILHHQAGDLDAALAAFDAALALDPHHADAQAQRSLVLLLSGRFRDGWDAYAARFDAQFSRAERRPYPQPRWDGAGTDAAVLVWGEQGIGDEILFAGLLADAHARVGHLMVECEARLVPLFERSLPDADVFARDDGPSPEGLSADMQCAIGDLGGLFRPDRASFPRPSAYLKADAEKTARFRADYTARGAPLIGLAWRSANPETGGRRSLSPAAFQPLFDALPDAVFVNLQYGDVTADIGDGPILCDPAVDQMTDMDAFAAQVAALDLVVSAANTTVHVAGALGVESHVLVADVPDWRWGLRGGTSLWYPNMTLHRRDAATGWDDAIAGLAQAL